jgi:hypothetical protein
LIGQKSDQQGGPSGQTKVAKRRSTCWWSG